MAKKYCPHCGASQVEYKRSLSKGLANSLRLLVSAGGVAVPVCSLALTNSEYSAFAKLRLWGVIEKIESPKDVKGRGGYWSITDKGWRFVRGEIQVPKYVIEYRGEVLEESEKMISIQMVAEGWWYKPRVVAESRPHPEPPHPQRGLFL